MCELLFIIGQKRKRPLHFLCGGHDTVLSYRYVVIKTNSLFGNAKDSVSKNGKVSQTASESRTFMKALFFKSKNETASVRISSGSI